MDKEELEKLFDTCDVTGTGHLDKNEFARLCQELNLKDDELQALFRSVDINKDGIIQKSEFVEKFYVVADLFFNAIESCEGNIKSKHCENYVTNSHCDAIDHLNNDLHLQHCESERDSENDSYFNDSTKIDDLSLNGSRDVLTPLPKITKQSINVPTNESLFLVSPPSGDPPPKRTSTPRALGGRVSRSGRFNNARGGRSWNSFAESLGNILFSLPSYDSISSLYKHLSEQGDPRVVNSYEVMLQQLLKDIENMQVSITELEASLQRVTEKSSEQLSILEEEMDAQINLKEKKAREEEREKADEEAKKLRTEYEDRISRLQQAVHKLKQVDERLSKVSPLENEVDNLRDKLREVTAENTSLSLRLSEAETQGVLLKTQVADLQVKLQEKRIIVDRESDVVRQVWTEREGLAQQVQSLTSNNRKLRDSNDDLREAAYKRLSSIPYQRSPSASFNGEFLSPYSSTVPSRLDYNLQSGRSSRASCESELLAFCDPKLSSIVSEDDVSHDDDTEADYSFKSSVDGTQTLVTNGFERDSGVGTIRDEHDSDTEVDGLRAYRSRFPISRTSVGSLTHFTPPRRSSLRRSSALQNTRRDVGYGDATDEDNDVEDVPSIEKKKRYNNRRTSDGKNPRRRITPTQPVVVGELYKIILCGDMGVGKSSFIFRTCKGEFNRHPRSTLGVDFQSKTLLLDSQQVVTLQLWDTAGQERFRSIAASYFRRADGVILVYDVTNQSTFLNVKEWMETISNSAPEETPVMICGNKVDLRDSEIGIMREAVYQKEGAQLAADYGVLFMECSAASGLNVLNAVTLLARHLATKKRNQVNSGSIKDLTNIPEKESKCCARN